MSQLDDLARAAASARPKNRQAPESSQAALNAGAAMILLAIAGLVSFFVLRPSASPGPLDPRPQLIAAADEAVTQRLKAPSTAQFPSSSGHAVSQLVEDDRWRVRGWVDAQNSFGAMLRSHFVVDLQLRNGKITVLNVTIADPN